MAEPIKPLGAPTEVPTRYNRFYSDCRLVVFPLCGFGDRIPTYVEMAAHFAKCEASSAWFSQAVAAMLASDRETT